MVGRPATTPVLPRYYAAGKVVRWCATRSRVPRWTLTIVCEPGARRATEAPHRKAPQPKHPAGQIVPTRRQGRPVRTYSPKPGEVERQWHVIDAADVVLGRLATHAATLLRGKHKPTFAPHVDTGDFVIVVNAGKVALTGNKRQTKVAYRHSGYPGGLKQVGYDELLGKRPERAIELAVKGMLPHNKLGRKLIKKLKVYAGADHPHAAQMPKPFEIKQIAQ
jgi:large subunit ribosomal protein L13